MLLNIKLLLIICNHYILKYRDFVILARLEHIQAQLTFRNRSPNLVQIRYGQQVFRPFEPDSPA